MPVDAAILWRPAGSDRGRAHEQSPIFLVSRVLDALRAHGQALSKHGVLGFLVGDLCQDATSGAPYLLVDSTIRLNQAVYGDRTSAVMPKLWDRVQAELVKTGGRLLGWYHSHPPQGVALAPGDVETHLHYFTRPWQFALVLGADATGPVAAFYRPGRDALSVATHLAFYELTEPSSAGGTSAKRSANPWTNFLTDDTLIDGPRVVAEAARKPTTIATTPSTTLEVVGRQASEVSPPPAAKVTADVASEPSPPPAPPAPVPPRPPTPPELSNLPLLHVEPQQKAAPGPTSPARPRALARAPAPHAEPRLPASPGLRRPLTVPRPAARKRARRWPRILLALALLGGLAAGAWLQGWVALPWPVQLPEWIRLPAWLKRPSGGAGAVEVAAVDSALLRLDALADSLSRAVGGYRERATLFDRRRVACDDLRRGLVAVEQRWIAYNERGRAQVRALDAARDGRDRALHAAVDSVTRHFERSACARP